MTIVDSSRVLPKREMERENGLSLDIPSSPYGPTVNMMSSRRGSLVSSTNFSIAPSFGTTGSNTPSSYASSEVMMGDISMSNIASNVSFSESSRLDSSTIGYDMSFIPPDYGSQKPFDSWDASSATDILGLQLGLSANDLQLQQGLYDHGNSISQEDSFLIPTTTTASPPGLEPLCDNTIVPGQMHHSIHATTASPFPVYLLAPQNHRVYEQVPLLESLDQTHSLDHIYPQSLDDCSPSKKQSYKRRDVKRGKNGLIDRARKAVDSEFKIEEPSVTPSGKFECPWILENGEICGKAKEKRFARKEHMTRHLKPHVTSSLKDIKQKASDTSYWAILLPHLTIVDKIAKARIGNVLALGIYIPEEVLKEIFRVFPADELYSPLYYTTDYDSLDDSTLCPKCRKYLSRPDNLRQHIMTRHIEQAPNGSRLGRTPRCYEKEYEKDMPTSLSLRERLDWDEIAMFDWIDLAEACCQKQEESPCKALNLINTRSSSKRKSNSRTQERKVAKRRSSSSPSSATRPDKATMCHYRGQPDTYENRTSHALFEEMGLQ